MSSLLPVVIQKAAAFGWLCCHHVCFRTWRLYAQIVKCKFGIVSTFFSLMNPYRGCYGAIGSTPTILTNTFNAFMTLYSFNVEQNATKYFACTNAFACVLSC